MKNTTLKPIQVIRLGLIKAVIWKNETGNGVFYKVNFARLYKEGDKWRTTESFGRDDLLLLVKVADAAHSWIWETTQKEHGKVEAIPMEVQNIQVDSQEDDPII